MVTKAATSMSWFAYCAPPKYSGIVSSTISTVRARASPTQRRTNRYSVQAASVAPSTEARRAANSWAPNADMAAAVSQYHSGGLWKNGRPSSVGTSQSRECSISQATPT